MFGRVELQELYALPELEEAHELPGPADDPAALVMNVFRHHFAVRAAARERIADFQIAGLSPATHTGDIWIRPFLIKNELENLLKLQEAIRNAEFKAVANLGSMAIMEDGVKERRLVRARVNLDYTSRFYDGHDANGHASSFNLYGRWLGITKYRITPLDEAGEPQVELTNL